MEPSPLTQQVRPEVFQQKIVKLYDALFKVGSYHGRGAEYVLTVFLLG